MTQPVSNRPRWAGVDLTCSEDYESFTCDETAPSRCVAPREESVDRPFARASPDVSAGHRFCSEADTVFEGFLCNDSTAVSNACRKPNNDFDRFVCDDPRMQELQWAILRETWSLLKSLALAIVRAKP
jgi:hypothetical protein